MSRWRSAITKLIMKRSAVRNITRRSGRFSRMRWATAESRCVLPRPEPAWMNSGLKLTAAPGAASATRHMAAWASWFEEPTTKVSKVWLGSSCGSRSAAAACAAAITDGLRAAPRRRAAGDARHDHRRRARCGTPPRMRTRTWTVSKRAQFGLADLVQLRDDNGSRSRTSGSGWEPKRSGGPARSPRSPCGRTTRYRDLHQVQP